MNRPQNGDQLPLSEMLAAMRRIGVAPEEYVVGYEAGFKGAYSSWPTTWTQDQVMAYWRGCKAGHYAWKRRAHSEAKEEV